MSGLAIITLAKTLPGMRHEAGGHRIQRIPPTERRGRVHTSTVTVSVLEGGAVAAPVTIDERDLSIRWFSGTGAGGQHRNKHQNCVELTHIPTGLRRSAQTRARESSMREAMTMLEADVSALERSQAHAGINATRSAQIGIGMRGDKRRTYRFRDDKVADDLTGKSTSCSRAMRGGIDQLWPASDRLDK